MSKLLAIASVLCAGLWTASAQAEVIAGWDFSQFRNPGSLVGAPVPLPANYSVVDPNGAGAEAGNVGEASVVGGSWLPTAGEGFNCERLPNGGKAGCAPPNVDGPVRSNRSEPFSQGDPDFDALSILRSEGQTWTNRFAMLAPGGDVVLELEVSAPFLGGGAEDWMLSLGGRMASGNAGDGGQIGCSPGCTADVEARFSGTTCAAAVFGPIVSDTLDLDDDRVVLDLNAGPDATTVACVELTISGGAAQLPIFDNLAVEATPLPEPSVSLSLLAGVGCLLGLSRFRR
jgi:hypothetical protein